MESVEKGKGLIIAIMTIILTFDFINAVFLFLTESNTFYTLIYQSLKLLAECVILFFLFKGHYWAKWVTCTILIIYGIIPLLTFIANQNPIKLLLAAFYFIFGIALLVSKEVKYYMDYKNGRIQIDSSKDEFD